MTVLPFFVYFFYSILIKTLLKTEKDEENHEKMSLITILINAIFSILGNTMTFCRTVACSSIYVSTMSVFFSAFGITIVDWLPYLRYSAVIFIIISIFSLYSAKKSLFYWPFIVCLCGSGLILASMIIGENSFMLFVGNILMIFAAFGNARINKAGFGKMKTKQQVWKKIKEFFILNVQKKLNFVNFLENDRFFFINRLFFFIWTNYKIKKVIILIKIQSNVQLQNLNSSYLPNNNTLTPWTPNTFSTLPNLCSITVLIYAHFINILSVLSLLQEEWKSYDSPSKMCKDFIYGISKSSLNEWLSNSSQKNNVKSNKMNYQWFRNLWWLMWKNLRFWQFSQLS